MSPLIATFRVFLGPVTPSYIALTVNESDTPVTLIFHKTETANQHSV